MFTPRCPPHSPCRQDGGPGPRASVGSSGPGRPLAGTSGPCGSHGPPAECGDRVTDRVLCVTSSRVLPSLYEHLPNVGDRSAAWVFGGARVATTEAPGSHLTFSPLGPESPLRPGSPGGPCGRRQMGQLGSFPNPTPPPLGPLGKSLTMGPGGPSGPGDPGRPCSP